MLKTARFNVSGIIKWASSSNCPTRLGCPRPGLQVVARATIAAGLAASLRLDPRAMVCARTCAMSFNRIVDRHFDKANPAPRAAISAPEGFLCERVGVCWLSGFGLVVGELTS